MIDPAKGEVLRPAGRQPLGHRRPRRPQTQAKPLATVGANAAIAVGVDGSGARRVGGRPARSPSCVPVVGDSFDTPVTDELGFSRASSTGHRGRQALGRLRPGTGKLYAEGLDKPAAGGAAEPGGPAFAALQQPGPDAGSVLLQDESTTELKVVGLGRGARPGRGPAPPGAPGGGAAQGRRDRSASATASTRPGPRRPRPTTAQLRVRARRSRPAPSGKTRACRADGVTLRVNRGLIVLNDLDSGDVWDLDSKPIKIDNWDSVIPPPQDRRQEQEEGREPRRRHDRCRSPRRPSRTTSRCARVARRSCTSSTTTPTPPGSILAIAPGDVSQPGHAGVTASVAADGQTIDVTRARASPSVQSFSFSYKVNNGTRRHERRPGQGHRLASSTSRSTPPPSLRAGTATLAQTDVPGRPGKAPARSVSSATGATPRATRSASQPADPTSLVDGLGRLDVQAREKAGTQAVEYSVDDGRGGTQGHRHPHRPRQGRQAGPAADPARRRARRRRQAAADRAARQRHRRRRPDRAGRADATGRRAVQAPGALDVDTNLDTGVVTVTGQRPGTFDAHVRRAGRLRGRAGRVRVDLIADPDPDAPPVAVPDAADAARPDAGPRRRAGQRLQPARDVLVVQRCRSTGDAWLRPSIYQGRWVRIEALDPARRWPAAPRHGHATRSATAPRPPSARSPSSRSRPQGEGPAEVVDDVGDRSGSGTPSPSRCSTTTP